MILEFIYSMTTEGGRQKAENKQLKIYTEVLEKENRILRDKLAQKISENTNYEQTH